MYLLPIVSLVGIFYILVLVYLFNTSAILSSNIRKSGLKSVCNTDYFLHNSDILQPEQNKTEIQPSPIVSQPEIIVSEPEIVASEPESDRFDFTYVTQTSEDRICYFTHFVDRWSGPFSITVSYISKHEASTHNAIKRMDLPERFQIHYYKRESSKVYPINVLRNLAIRGVKTSHFWLTDMDMWPTPTLYETLSKLPDDILAQPKHAIIVPAFEIDIGKGACRTFSDCANKMEYNLPRNKQGLNSCIASKKCDKFRPKQYLHNYYFDEWFDLNYTAPLTPVKCFKGNRQEPYVVVKKTPEMPLFDERFVNYGYNKVQWLENLRYVGYQYSVLTDGFAVDIPHPRSSFQVAYITELYAKKGKNITMEVLYKEFLTELKQNITDQSVVKKC